MAQIRPPGPWNSDIHEWHNTYRPDFFTNVAMGYLQGSTTTLMRATIDVGSTEVLFDDSLYTDISQLELPVPTPCFLVSDDPADTGTFLVSTLASDGARVRAFTTLNGTTPVPIADGIDCEHVRNMIQVAGTLHAGTIYASNNGTGVPIPASDRILVRVPPGNGFGASPLTVCPANLAFVFAERVFSCAAGTSAVVRFKIRFAGTSVYSTTFEIHIGAGMESVVINPPIVLSEGDALFVTVQKQGMIPTKVNVSYHLAHVLLDGEVGNQRGADLIFERNT